MPSRKSRRAIDLEVSEIFDKGDSSDSDNDIEKKKSEKKDKPKTKPVEDIPEEVIKPSKNKEPESPEKQKKTS